MGETDSESVWVGITLSPRCGCNVVAVGNKMRKNWEAWGKSGTKYNVPRKIQARIHERCPTGSGYLAVGPYCCMQETRVQGKSRKKQPVMLVTSCTT